jgi:hypothetical protein
MNEALVLLNPKKQNTEPAMQTENMSNDTLENKGNVKITNMAPEHLKTFGAEETVGTVTDMIPNRDVNVAYNLSSTPRGI